MLPSGLSRATKASPGPLMVVTKAPPVVGKSADSVNPHAVAAQTATLTGRVLDRDTRAPLAGALVALALGRNRRAVKVWALVVTLADLALAGVLLGFFDPGSADLLPGRGLQRIPGIGFPSGL